ncbi:twin-arginine translocase subunit TatC [Pacificimonas sp. WHA3]|uniref:Sec-independent protein translocase protein TatC n=1 Tax=Pacificimonas pallii TaxID=2827236 RepID=A0ABS6SGB7_9SPHN|nr:twin-arginine translocase subunit TatC [Pacificimonas pallii]MBV7257469.1 twin-arginine translocase subunit TatC [Pacificimonas pallii]
MAIEPPALVPPANEVDASKAPLLDHLIELRTRLLWSLAALMAAFFIAFYFSDQLLAFLAQPLLTAYDRVGEAPPSSLIYTKLYEAFFTKIKVALFAAFLCAFPVIANQLWGFVAPGLYKNEKRAFLPFLLATPILFFGGAAMAYFIAMPTVYTFMLQMQGTTNGVSLTALPAVGDFLSFTMSIIFAFGACFLVPVALMLLAKVGIINVAQLKSFRRYAIVIAFVIAAVVTPPDVISQFMLAVPMILLYELSIIAITLTQRRSKAGKDAVRTD